jgi:hypothetical protein
MCFVRQVRTLYVLISQITYLVHPGMYCVYKNMAGDAFLCTMPVGNDTVCAWHVRGFAPTLHQCPYWCPTHRTLFWWILSTYWYVLVCTIIPVLYWSVSGTYRYVLLTNRYILNTLFLYNASRFQMNGSRRPAGAKWSCVSNIRAGAVIYICLTLILSNTGSLGFPKPAGPRPDSETRPARYKLNHWVERIFPSNVATEATQAVLLQVRPEQNQKNCYASLREVSLTVYHSWQVANLGPGCMRGNLKTQLPVAASHCGTR